MSAQEERGREPPKPKGKTLGSFLGSLPGFSSARNLLASAHSSVREARPAADPASAPTAQAAQPQAQAATDPELTAKGVEKLPPPADKMTSGAKDVVCSTMTRTKDAISSGMANVVDSAKGAVQGGLGMTRSALTGTKEAVASGVTGAVGVAKEAIHTGVDTTKTVLTGTKDTVSTGLTGAMNVAKGAVQTGVDTSKTLLTGTKDTVSTGLTGAMNVAKGAVQTGVDTSKTLLTGTKDTVYMGLTGAMNVAKGAVQTGMDTSKTVLAGTKDAVSTGLGVATGSMQCGQGTTQNWLLGIEDTCGGLIHGRAPDKCREQAVPSSQADLSYRVCSSPEALCAGLDLAGEVTAASQGVVSAVMSFTPEATRGVEEARCVATTRGCEGATGSAMPQDELEGLGEIFHPMTAEEQAQLAAAQLGPRMPAADQGSYFMRLGDLTPGFRQRAFEHALSHLQHGQFQAREALARLEDSFRAVPDAGALSRARGFIQQLHVAYSTLASGLQGLPAELQQQVGWARHSLCELYGLVSSAGSISELPAERLAQSHAGVVQAWRGLEQLLVSVQHRPPLSWLVGPFALHPSGQQL
ncbi:perilipin-4 isoform X6 [Pteropus medius]|uniref:perilipin-4 isoform X4 n=1 Tax=Pteropus vampyrus TaxID=132908 RepID=UPI00196A4654|nr:perilipin-4 isoform X4 [Pteropus giganteus]XP_039734332.1 perilipin-4 isoform X6 [Pteropus giganteus]